MIRHCDGTDEFLQTIDGAPCRCGLTFDDVEFTVIYPHPPTRGPLVLDHVELLGISFDRSGTTMALIRDRPTDEVLRIPGTYKIVDTTGVEDVGHG